MNLKYLCSMCFTVAFLTIGEVSIGHVAEDIQNSSSLLPLFDSSADRDHIKTNSAGIEADERIDGHMYFDAPVPRKIHQV